MPKDEQVKKKQRLKQIQQTQADFTTALFQLLKVKSINQISVKEVTQRAGYARRTFYSHFDSLEAILSDYIDRLTVNLFQFISSNDHNQFTKMIESFFNYWIQHKAFLTLLARNDCLSLLEKSWQNNLAYSELGHSELKQSRYAQAFALGGMYSMLIAWIKNDFQESANEMEREAQRMIHHLITVQ